MPEKVSPGPLRGNPAPKEAVCIHTRKVYDSCRDKECLQDLRVCMTRTSQAVLEAASSVKARGAELLWTYIDVEPISFNKGFFTVDVTYYYKVTADAYVGQGRPREICGLATYEKRTVLFGSEGSVRVFSSQHMPGAGDAQCMEKSNLPIAVVEVVDPVILGLRVADDDRCGDTAMSGEIPECIRCCFDDDVLMCSDDPSQRRLYATLGQFSIIKLERDIQLLMPAFDICMPDKECVGTGSAEDPCSLFERFRFPVDEFFPPRMNGTANGAVVAGVTASNGNCSTNCGCRR